MCEEAFEGVKNLPEFLAKYPEVMYHEELESKSGVMYEADGLAWTFSTKDNI